MTASRTGELLKARYLLPTLYVGIALFAWLEFMRLPPDGLANVGLMIVVFPIMLLDLYLRPRGDAASSALIPQRWGYYADNTVFFWVSVTIIAIALSCLGRMIDRLLSRF